MSRSTKHDKNFEYTRHRSQVPSSKFKNMVLLIRKHYEDAEIQSPKYVWRGGILWFSFKWYTRKEIK